MATIHDVELLRECLPENVGVKACGGIETLDVVAMINAGAGRIGSAVALNILEPAAPSSGRADGWSFSQAIAEGDGISIVPVLGGDVAELAALAEDAGAEAVAVRGRTEVETARARTGLPILVVDAELVTGAAAPAADAVSSGLETSPRTGGSRAPTRLSSSTDWTASSRFAKRTSSTRSWSASTRIILISERDVGDGEDLERTLDLLPNVPAGKLVVSESRVNVRERVVALERAGVDAVLVGADVLRTTDFSAVLAELTGR